MSDLFDINVKSPIYKEDPNSLEEDSYNYDVYNTTEEKEAENELNNYEKTYTSENPTSTTEVDDNTIKMMFGDNWNGSYTDVTSIVSKTAEKLAWQMTMYNSMSEYLTAQENQLVDNITTKTGLYQIKLAVDNVQNDYNSICNAITNFKSFGYTSGSSNVLWSADSILANMENTTSSILKLENKVDDIIKYIQNNNNNGQEIVELMDKQFNNVQDILSQQNLNQLLYNFPQSVVTKFMGVDFVQELYTMPQQLYKKIINIISIISSIQAPENKFSVLEIIKLLRSSVAQMKDVQSMLSRGMDQINALKSNIQNGNYIGVFLQAKSACKFVEKTSQYAAQYPYNQAHETISGHIFETDNTPGKERLHVQHCSGTDVEIAPNGDMVSKIKNDCQFIVEKDFQNHVKGNQLLLVDDTSEVQSKSMKMTAAEDLNLSAKTTTFTSDDLNVLTDNVMLTAQRNMTLAANTSGSISCNGPLYLSSLSQVIIDAPSIIIGEGRASLITLNSTGNITSTSSGANIINSPMTNINSSSVFVGEGIIKMNGFITLN